MSTGWTCKGNESWLVLTTCNCITSSAGTALEIKNHLPLHKPKWHEYTSRNLHAVIDLNPIRIFFSPFRIFFTSSQFPPYRYFTTSFLPEGGSFFLMKAKDILPVTLLSHMLIFNLALLINVVIIVLPFPAQQWVWWQQTLSSVSITGPQKFPHPWALPSLLQGHGPSKSQGICASGLMLGAWCQLLELICEAYLCWAADQAPAAHPAMLTGIPAERLSVCSMLQHPPLYNRRPGRHFCQTGTNYKAGSKLNILPFRGEGVANASGKPPPRPQARPPCCFSLTSWCCRQPCLGGPGPCVVLQGAGWQLGADGKRGASVRCRKHPLLFWRGLFLPSRLLAHPSSPPVLPMAPSCSVAARPRHHFLFLGHPSFQPPSWTRLGSASSQGTACLPTVLWSVRCPRASLWGRRGWALALAQCHRCHASGERGCVWPIPLFCKALCKICVTAEIFSKTWAVHNDEERCLHYSSLHSEELIFLKLFYSIWF